MSNSIFENAKMLAGKTALVTGGTSGIGLGVAKRFQSLGANVWINSHEAPKDVAATLEDLNSNSALPKVQFAQADMADNAKIDEMLGGVLSANGRIDILVNNVGIQHVSPIDEFPAEKWQQIIDINLSSAFHLTKRCLPGMSENGWGRVINIASAHGLVASPFKSAYVAAKHGVLGLTKVTALEQAEKGVTSNAICPGYVWTPLVEKQLADQCRVHGLSKEEVIENIMLAPQPTKKFVQIVEVAELAAFLCGDLAGSITGASLPIDGGWTAR